MSYAKYMTDTHLPHPLQLGFSGFHIDIVCYTNLLTCLLTYLVACVDVFAVKSVHVHLYVVASFPFVHLSSLCCRTHHQQPLSVTSPLSAHRVLLTTPATETAYTMVILRRKFLQIITRVLPGFPRLLESPGFFS